MQWDQRNLELVIDAEADIKDALEFVVSIPYLEPTPEAISDGAMNMSRLQLPEEVELQQNKTNAISYGPCMHAQKMKSLSDAEAVLDVPTPLRADTSTRFRHVVS